MRLDAWEKAPKVMIRLVMAIPVNGAPKKGAVVQAVSTRRNPRNRKRGDVRWWVNGESKKPIGILSQEAEEVALCLRCSSPVETDSGYCDGCKDRMETQ